MQTRRVATVMTSLGLLSCASASPPTAPTRIPATVSIALVGATVLPMTTDVVLRDQTILIRNGVIVAVGPTATLDVPSDARVLDVRGRFVMPGLVDMHVHRAIRDAALYVPAGITTVRNLWGYPGLQAFAAAVPANPADVPTILTISPGIDGHPESWPGTRFLENASTVRDSVAKILEEGWPALKIYDHLPAASFDSVMAVARDRNVRVVGHVPYSVSIQHALAERMHEIEHLTGYDEALSTTGRPGTRDWTAIDPARMQPLVSATVSAGTWNCATLMIISEVYRSWPAGRDAVARNRRMFVKALADGGARLIIGTDSGIDIVPAGSTIIDEIEEHILAGLTPYAVLRAATANAAESLGRPGEFGSVGIGARADLLVLDRNPLDDRATLRSPNAVVLRGTWIRYR